MLRKQGRPVLHLQSGVRFKVLLVIKQISALAYRSLCGKFLHMSTRFRGQKIPLLICLLSYHAELGTGFFAGQYCKPFQLHGRPRLEQGCKAALREGSLSQPPAGGSLERLKNFILPDT